MFWALWWTRKRAAALTGLLPITILLAYNVFFTGSTPGVSSLVFTAGGILALQACTSFGSSRARWSALRMESAGIETRLVLLVALLAVSMMLAGSLLPVVPVRQLAHALDTLIHPPADGNLAESFGIQQTPISSTPLPPEPTPVYSASATGSHMIAAAPEVDKSLAFLISVEGYRPPPSTRMPACIPATAFIIIGAPAPTMNTTVAAGRRAPSAWTRCPRVVPSARRWTSPACPKISASSPSTWSACAPVTGPSSPPGNCSASTSPPPCCGAIPARSSPCSASRAPTPPSRAGSTRARTTCAPPGQITQPPSAATSPCPNPSPTRVLDLALDLTAGEPTPYDRAALLEAYLRQFTYSLDAPAPPSGRDAVDYFLFDLKSGYCDYFASAMVVMARASGLPARLVLGYSEGTYDPSGGYFVVRAFNAHAWAEIYFPGFGWVEFEPTPNLPRPVRPGELPESEQAQDLPPPGREAPLSLHLERTALGRLILKLSALLAILLLLPLLPLERWYLSLLPVDRALGSIFRSLYRRGRAFGIPADGSRTPDEFALALAGAVEGVVVMRRICVWLKAPAPSCAC